jgi:hypothetical protein
MVKIRIKSKYHDNELDRDMNVGDILEVTEERARMLLDHPRISIEILRIDKLSKRTNAETNSSK